MITDLLISLAELIFAPLNALLPALHFPSWASSAQLTTSVGTELGGYLAAVKGVVPVDVLLTVIDDVLVMWEVLVFYLLFEWVWDHVPTIAGFGTGDG
jgi:hypothetical protein